MSATGFLVLKSRSVFLIKFIRHFNKLGKNRVSHIVIRNIVNVLTVFILLNFQDEYFQVFIFGFRITESKIAFSFIFDRCKVFKNSGFAVFIGYGRSPSFIPNSSFLIPN